MDKQLKPDTLLEDVLRAEPLAPMPRSITLDVMARIQSPAAKRPGILTWSDFFLSSVIAACIAAGWFALQQLPPIFLAKLRIQGILLYQDLLVNARWLVPTLAFGLAAVLAALTIPSLLQMINRQR
jgi:hypothetical protein